jgi:hypothetical protein
MGNVIESPVDDGTEELLEESSSPNAKEFMTVYLSTDGLHRPSFYPGVLD